nr:hypothetical protein [Prolixibacter bellariivorans]
MKILLVGSGGREHALAWKIKQSPKIDQLFIAPGNAGTAETGTNLNIGVNDFNGLRDAVTEHDIDIVVVGPEVPLVEGIVGFFAADEQVKNIPVIGPDKEGARLEGSKDFAKDFMVRHDIPTAKYLSVTTTNLEEGIGFLKTLKAPFVLKADALRPEKGFSSSIRWKKRKLRCGKCWVENSARPVPAW